MLHLDTESDLAELVGQQQAPALAELKEALAKRQAGIDPHQIPLSDKATALLIGVEVCTLQKGRYTGTMLGHPAPSFTRQGRRVRYMLGTVLDWLNTVTKTYTSTADAAVKEELS